MKLSEIREELRSLAENVRNLKADIKFLRHGRLAENIRQVKRLRRSNAPFSQIMEARKAAQRTRLDVQDMASLKHEDRMLMWCLRGCIRRFLANVNRPMLDLCSANC